MLLPPIMHGAGGVTVTFETGCSTIVGPCPALLLPAAAIATFWRSGDTATSTASDRFPRLPTTPGFGLSGSMTDTPG